MNSKADLRADDVNPKGADLSCCHGEAQLKEFH
jgi:hypothetical protein